MMASEPLSESLLKLVDCGGQREFVELAVPNVRVEGGTELTLEAREEVSTIQCWPYSSLPNGVMCA